MFVAFLASPWGLIVPLTAFVLLLASGLWTTYVTRNPSLFWNQFATVSPSALAERLDLCAARGDFTLPVLVAGLGHTREPIHTFCRQRLMAFVTTDATQIDANDLQKYERLAVLLADASVSWGPTPRRAAAEIARAMLHQITATPFLAEYPHLITRINNACTDVVGNVDEAFARTQLFVDATMATSRGGPPNEVCESTEEMLAAATWREPKSGTGRSGVFQGSDSETLLVHRDTVAAQRALSNAFTPKSGGGAVDPSAGTTMLAMQNTPGPVGVLGGLQTDSGQSKIARRVTAPLELPKRLASDFTLEPVEQTPLGQVAVDDMDRCVPIELMRLLHHPSGRVRQRAEEILLRRDTFTPELLRLAYRLYHPDKAIRLELVSQLPGTIGISSLFWWDALVADPHPDVRYAAISFLATLQDPQIRQRVIERAAADSDPRISRIGTRLR